MSRTDAGRLLGPAEAARCPLSMQPGRRRGRLTAMGHRLHLLVLLLPLVATVGCGSAVAPDPGSGAEPAGRGSAGATGSDPTGAGADNQLYTATSTVLESPDHGPQLCLGGVAESYPPQCGGPDIEGWDWAAVTGAETANGTTWGSYTVVGTYDGERFTLTEPAAPPSAAPLPPDADDRFATPCPPPDGGWAVVDDALATDEAMQAALALAADTEGYAGSWVDQSINPAWDPDASSEIAGLNDPTKLVLNVTTTGEIAVLEAKLRTVWGGALCVSPAPRTEVELVAILEEISGEPGVLGGYPDTRAGTVEVQVVVDDGMQARMDEKYGSGLVKVVPVLAPVD